MLNFLKIHENHGFPRILVSGLAPPPVPWWARGGRGRLGVGPQAARMSYGTRDTIGIDPDSLGSPEVTWEENFGNFQNFIFFKKMTFQLDSAGGSQKPTQMARKGLS